MPDEGRIDTAIPVKVLFKREDNQSFVDVFPNELHASLAPCPELRRHVVHRRNSALLHLSRNSPVECRRVNHNRQTGLTPVSFIDQMFVDIEDSGQMTEYLSDS